MSQWLCYAKKGVHRHFKEKVLLEALLDIRDVIHQISCFSKTIVSITQPSAKKTSALSITH